METRGSLVLDAGGPAAFQEMLQANPAISDAENREVLRLAAAGGWQSIGPDAGAGAVSEFQGVAFDNGLAGALRTFARNGDFKLYLDGQSPMDLGAADKYLHSKPWVGRWQESARGQTPDARWVFAVGDWSVGKHIRYRFAQVWQFDSKVANWGMRLLLLKSLPEK